MFAFNYLITHHYVDSKNRKQISVHTLDFFLTPEQKCQAREQ